MKRKTIKRSAAHSVKKAIRRHKHVHKSIFCSCRGKLSIKYLIIGGVAILIVGGIGYFMFGNNTSTRGGIINKIANVGQKTAMQKLIEAQLQFVKDPILKKHYQADYSTNKKRIKNEYGPGAYQYQEIELLGGGDNLFDFEMNQHVWIEKNGQRKAEYIVLFDKAGDTTYVKDPSDNKWWKQTKPKEKEKTGLEQTKKEEEEYTRPEAIPTGPEAEFPKQVGKEKCPNAPSLNCYKYEEVEKDDIMKTITKNTIWFDDQQYLKRREENENSYGKTWAEYEYDNIDIKAPSPAKDVPPGKDIGEYMLNELSKTGTGGGFASPDQSTDSQPPYQAPEQNYETPQSYDEPANDDTGDTDSSDLNVEY